MSTRTALVTGGNRGIGLETCRQLAARGLGVILTARDQNLGEKAAGALRDEGLGVSFQLLDVTREGSIRACAERLQAAGMAVDVLINNAGIYPKGMLLDMDETTLRVGLEVNLLGAFLVTQAFLPGMIQRRYGRVVNVSSGCGSFAEGLECAPSYTISKVALNALTVKLAQELPPAVKVNTMCPGWVRTRMGGENAPKSVEEGADTVVWLATLPAGGPTGGFFRDRQPIPW